MTLQQPAWLILLVLLPLLGVGAIMTARLRGKQWSAFVAPRLRSVLLKRGSSLPRWFALGFLLLACAGMIGALARPRADAGTRTEKSLGRNVLIALDLSRSMRTKDVKPDRLSQAKVVIYELLESMPNERIGLIGFAGSSYLYAPLTVDHRAVRETVEQIDETWATLGGSNLAEAIHLAIDTLKKTGQKNNALVILSDGEKHEGDLDDMIARAEQAGVFILAIGVGTEDGDYVPNSDFPDKIMYDRSGQPIISRLQPDVMRKLAEETKGRYGVAGSGMDIPSLVKESIKDLDAFQMEGRERRIAIEFYQWLLFPALVFLFVSIIAGTRWRGLRTSATATAMAALCFIPAGAKADAVSEAKLALQEKRYPQARAAYKKLADSTTLPHRRERYQLGEANAAYLGKDYKSARKAFSRALLSEQPEVRANSAIGLGNTLFQLGWRGLAEQSYPAPSQAPPTMANFDEMVKKHLEKLKGNADPDQPVEGGYRRIESLVTNWADAVRHYDSALVTDPSNEEASNNRALTMAYLKRLQELLKQDKEETEQSMPQPQPGDGQPQEGDPKEKQPGEEGEPGDSPPKGKGEGDEEKKDGKGGEEDKPEGDSGKNKDQDKDKKESDKDGKIPDETPEDRARRILKENADLEKGPLTPGRRDFRAAEKDW